MVYTETASAQSGQSLCCSHIAGMDLLNIHVKSDNTDWSEVFAAIRQGAVFTIGHSRAITPI